jgi:hypothetical protein
MITVVFKGGFEVYGTVCPVLRKVNSQLQVDQVICILGDFHIGSGKIGDYYYYYYFILFFLTLENGTDGLSRNFGEKSPLLAAN